MDMEIKKQSNEKIIKLMDINLISVSSLEESCWKDKFLIISRKTVVYEFAEHSYKC